MSTIKAFHSLLLLFHFPYFLRRVFPVSYTHLDVYKRQIWGLVTVFGVAAGCGLGPYVGGLLKDITGNYQASIWLATGIYLLAAILAASVKKPEAKGTPIN